MLVPSECVEPGILDVGDGRTEHPSQSTTSTWMCSVLIAVWKVSFKEDQKLKLLIS